MKCVYRFRCDSSELRVTIGSIDERLLRAVVDRVYPEPTAPRSFGPEEMAAYAQSNAFVRRAFLWGPSHKPTAAPRAALLDELTAVERELRYNEGRYMHIYSSRGVIPVSVDGKEVLFPFSGTGGMLTGIRLDGDKDHSFTLRCDLGVCSLEKVSLVGESRGHMLEVIDIRGQKTLVSDNMGQIRLGRRRVKSELLRYLDDLVSLLSASDADSVAIDFNPGRA